MAFSFCPLLSGLEKQLSLLLRTPALLTKTIVDALEKGVSLTFIKRGLYIIGSPQPSRNIP